MGSHLIVSDSLNLQVHANFCNNLIKIINYSDIERNRILSVKLIKKYILQFDDDGKYFLLKNLMIITTHSSLVGYIFTIYKDVIAKKLDCGEELNEYYKGIEFKNIMLNFICNLNNDIETDLMQYSDRIISSLNILRYFIMRDKENKTGFWNFINEIKIKFLKPLRKAIDLSRAHYKAEEFKVRHDKNDINEFQGFFQALSKNLPELTKERKLNLLASAMITFDLIESILARVNECIDMNK